MKRYYGIILSAAFVCLAAACQPENPENPETPIDPEDIVVPVHSVALSETSLQLTVGDKVTLGVTVSPDYATDKSVIWSSSDETVATVSDAGSVEALKAGNAVITVTAKAGGKSASCAVSVDIAMGAVTDAATHISCRGAEIAGKAIIPSTATSTDVKAGVLYSTSSDILVSSPVRVEAQSFDSEYNFSIHTGVLTPEITYYYCSYVSKDGEYVYGDTKSFETLAVSSMIRTENASDIKTKGATLSATLDLTDCNYDNMEYGFEITPDGGTAYMVNSMNLSNGKFSLTVDNLQAATSYSCKAFVTLDAWTYMADASSFTTAELNAEVSVNDATDIDEYNATVSGSLHIESEGTFSKSARLYYSNEATTLSALKASGTEKSMTVDSDGSLSVQLTGLNHSSTYYYVIVATVDDKEFTSEVKSFSTKEIPELVDLGLSVKWRNWNLGASSPIEYGLYYQWGDTQGYGSNTSDGKYFSWKDKSGNDTYLWRNGSSLTKYNTDSYYGTKDGKTTLELADDAANAALSGNWRIPTASEWGALLNTDNCSWTWTTMNGVNGYKVQSKKAGYTDNYIFLPASAHRFKDELGDVGSEGSYWASSLDTGFTYNAYHVIFYSDSIKRTTFNRCYGLTIRPVMTE